ncbi:MAG: alpha/beta fold hydrolase [Magnetococcales bacterium]|nr:alpha/beta fold hydrolase [Magnetococcales bacterium]
MIFKPFSRRRWNSRSDCTRWWPGLLGLMLLLASEARADVLIMTHGYVSGDDAWVSSGVTAALARGGWEAGGRVRADGRGIVVTPAATGGGRKVYYLADLASEAPLSVQADQLREVAREVVKRRDRQEQMVLVGHSAGGVVARLAMAKDDKLGVFGLITIASPHLGTDKAEVAGLVASTPLSMVAPMMGVGTLNRSRQLYADLARERPGNLLHWLNRQPHPKARYHSLVRRESFPLMGDNTVPVWSQDLRKVEALREVAGSETVGSGHGLESEDGVALARILAEWLP